MFREELGSRLRGVGYTVHPYDDPEDLERRLDHTTVDLVILDLQHHEAGGIETLRHLISRDIPVIAIGEHKKTGALDEARKAGATKVIINSQASKSIEKYVEEILKKER